ncbi:MAG TPA: alpha-2-macroglobulin family protein, partial [Cyclobacteriaceae bacterium]|nr:alpha-2-macroglobulin family protein [Cyclobacteriaceae bacterium]
QQKINTANGKGFANFRINYPDWGRYLVRVSDPVSGHCSGKIIFVDWPGWAGRGQKEMPGGATMLTFTSDKDSYVVGETVKLAIPGSGAGRAFISVENGSKIIRNDWMETKQGENIFQVPVTDEFSPNVFIYVSLLQPHAQTLNDLPIRLYGIIPVRVDDPKTHLKPVIEMAEEIKPESEIRINVSEAEGKPMTYTLAVVDEGLLDLTNYKTPDPWDQFYKREGLGVKSWDIFDDVIGAFGGSLERLLSIGGDEEIKRPEGSRANRFKPVVIYLGPYHLDPGKSASHRIKMPAYIGSVRTMIVAGDRGAYGIAEKETPVRQPLMILATLPRVLGPEEEVTLPVTVFSYDPSVKLVETRIETGDLVEAVGNTSKSISFNQPGDQVVNYNLHVRPKTGVTTVNVNAKSGSNSASDRIEIEIRNPNPPMAAVYEAMLEPGKNWETGFEYAGVEGTNKSTLEVSNIPPIDLNRRLNYLLSYPYGCVEQTTSAVFPQLYLRDIADLTQEMNNAVDIHVKAGIEKLRTFQNSDGGFKYWPNNYYADEWSTSYAGHFLVEARKKGFNVPDFMIRDWVKYQKRQVNLWYKSQLRNSDLVQAYRLYTLALAGEAQVGSMNRLRETDISSAARWRLGAAYQLAGLGDAAKEITNNIITTPADYRELSYTYGSSLRDEAMILEALVLMGRKSEGMDLMKKISSALSDNRRWMSTQEIAYSLIAVSSFAGKEERSAGIRFDYTWNISGKVTASTDLAFIQKPLQTGTEIRGKISLANTGSGVIYVRIIHEGIPAVSNEVESSNGLNMTVTYKDAGGKLIDISRILQGTELVAEVSVVNPGTRGEYKELALSQIFSSGFEIINERMTEEAPGQGASQGGFKYQDIRDDRIYTYFDLAPGIRKMFRVKLVATYAGRFYLPGVYCEAMYDNSINARSKGQWSEITLSQTE